MVHARALNEPDDGLSSLARSLRTAAPWLDAMSKLTGGTVLGVAVGYGLDWKFGWSPWGLLTGSMLGIGFGFYGFLRAALAMGKKK